MTTSRHVRKIICVIIILGFPGGSDGKESACNVVELSLIPGLVRSPGEGGGRRVQDGEHMYTCGGFILMFDKTNTIM